MAERKGTNGNLGDESKGKPVDERKGTKGNLGDERKGKPVKRKSEGGHGWKGQRLGLQSLEMVTGSQMDCRQDGEWTPF